MAHLPLLRRIARALFSLDAAGLLGPSTRPPIMIGTLYEAGGFNWQSRVAFYSKRPGGFVAWKRPMGLFALKAFPYLCKLLAPGEVRLHGQFPQLQVAVAPSDAATHRHAGVLLDRVLQTATTGKSLEFLGLCANWKLGRDGAVVEERAALLRNGGDGEAYLRGGIEVAASARNAMMIAAQTHKQLKQAKVGGGIHRRGRRHLHVSSRRDALGDVEHRSRSSIGKCDPFIARARRAADPIAL